MGLQGGGLRYVLAQPMWRVARCLGSMGVGSATTRLATILLLLEYSFAAEQLHALGQLHLGRGLRRAAL